MERESLIEKLSRQSRRKKLVFFLMAVIIICGFYWFIVFQPKFEKIQKLNQQVQELNNQISIYKKKVSHLSELEKKFSARKEELVYARKLLPESSHDVETLLSDIEKLGKDVGVEFLLFAPGSENIHDFYATREVKLKLRGGFHNLMRFFSEISRLDRLVTVKSIDLKPINQNPNEEILLTTNSELSVYRDLTPKERKAKNNNKK